MAALRPTLLVEIEGEFDSDEEKQAYMDRVDQVVGMLKGVRQTIWIENATFLDVVQLDQRT